MESSQRAEQEAFPMESWKVAFAYSDEEPTPSNVSLKSSSEEQN